MPQAARRPAAFAAVVAAALLALVLSAPAAGAHSGLTDASVPGPSQTVEQLDGIRLVFQSPVEEDAGNTIELSTIDDRFVELGPLEIVDDGHALRTDVRGSFPDTGEYLLLYTVATTDGDGLQDGGFTFTYDGPVARGVRPAWLVAGAVLLVLLAVVVAVRRRRG